MEGRDPYISDTIHYLDPYSDRTIYSRSLWHTQKLRIPQDYVTHDYMGITRFGMFF